jgi:ATP-dependent RNA helicase RhlE
MSFDTLGLSPELLRAVHDQGYSEPTPIQQKAIPTIMAGQDVMAAAQTGTGKTAGFPLPLLHRLSTQQLPKGRRPIRALVLTPTRELAAQVQASIQTYGSHLPLRSTVIFGGVKINPQIAQLNRGVDILVATPGRLLDHASQGTLSLKQVEILVLDEADRMLDMGFIHDIRKVLALLPASQQRQNLLFSATFSDEIKQLADRLLDHPKLIEAAPRNTTAERIDQVVHPVDRHRKRELLSHLIGRNDWRQVLVFTRTKHGANRLAEQLDRDGLTAAAIHGNKSQGARTRALSGFKNGDVRVLVATDIAARGLDIDQLPHVVNYELPNVPEDYVHRIGRTGRAGREGQAVSLVCVDEHKLLRDIERLLKRSVPQVVLEGYEPDPNAVAEPIPNGRGNARNQPRQNRGARPTQSPGHGQRRPRRAEAETSSRSEGESAHGRQARGEHVRHDAPRKKAAANPRHTPTRRSSGPNGPNPHRPARRSRPQEVAALFGGGRKDH